MQMDLFDAGRQPKVARASDPATSQTAAQRIADRLPRLHGEFLRRLFQRGEPSTANEIAAGDESIRKRAKELVEKGVIKIVGDDVCSVTGQMAHLYWIA